MSDNLIEEIIQKSLSERDTAKQPAQFSSEASPIKKSPRKRLNPLLVPTVLLSLALIAALFGLMSQQQQFHSKMAETVETYEQELIKKDRLIELRTEEAENWKSRQQLFVALYQETSFELNGILRAEVILGLYKRNAYEQAAIELTYFKEQVLSLPQNQQLWPGEEGSSLGASEIAGLLPLYRVDYQSRLEEVAQSLLDMGYIEQSLLDYVVSLRNAHLID